MAGIRGYSSTGQEFLCAAFITADRRFKEFTAILLAVTLLNLSRDYRTVLSPTEKESAITFIETLSTISESKKVVDIPDINTADDPIDLVFNTVNFTSPRHSNSEKRSLNKEVLENGTTIDENIGAFNFFQTEN